MSEDRPLGREEAAEALGRMGARPDGEFDLAEAALLLAALDRPRVRLGRYRDHLRTLAGDAEAAARSDGGAGSGPGMLDEALAALAKVIYGLHGYAGDDRTYDDVQNANLMRVIDRRRGLPVSLGILYIATARALGLDARGVNFPAHFLVQLDRGGERALIDPFSEGRVCGAAELRARLKTALGDEAELEHRHYAAMSDRDVLLRLQNNIKFRLVQEGRFDPAARVLDSMLLIAPDFPPIWYEAGMLQARLGNVVAAIAGFEGFLDRAGGTHPDSHRAAALVQELRTKLN